MRLRPTASLVIALVVIGRAGPVETTRAQTPATGQRAQLTLERIFGSSQLSSDLVQLRWMDDGRHFTIIERDTAGLTDLFRVEARSGERERIVSGAALLPPQGGEPIRIQSYEFATDGSKLLIYTDVERIWRYSTRGTYYVWDFEAETLTPISRKPGAQQYAKFAPDGRSVAFVRANDLFVTDLETGRETALTTDGSEDILNGTADWVYEEELVLYDAFRWSPDGRRIAFWRFDQTAIPPFYLLDESQLYPALVPVRYPKAGTSNSEVRIGVIDVGTGDVSWIDLGRSDGYIARMDFAGSANEIWLQRLNRHQNRMELLIADVDEGRSRVVLTDTDEAWIELREPIWVKDGSYFLHVSERERYARLYLYNRAGQQAGILMRNDWDIRDVYGVDESNELVYFSTAAEGPLHSTIYRIGLDGKGLQRISGDVGTHKADFDPTFGMYVDTYSRFGVPPTQTLRNADGSAIRTIAENADLRKALEEIELGSSEFITVPGESDVVLNAWLIKPPDFDPSRRYPLIMYVYGGPGSQTVTDAWGGDRYLWHQMLARQGYLVASVDNRGTGARGAAFRKIVYRKLGQYESSDQIAAARHLGSLAYVDEDRIGIWGWSYGGYMSALSIMRGARVFETAMAVAPVTDWRLYDTIYTERYMRTPGENPFGYHWGSVLTYVPNLEGDLLVVHGTGDDNVHPQHTTRLVKELENANQPFDMRLYPGKAHALSGARTRVNVYGLLTEYLRENL